MGGGKHLQQPMDLRLGIPHLAGCDCVARRLCGCVCFVLCTYCSTEDFLFKLYFEEGLRRFDLVSPEPVATTC